MPEVNQPSADNQPEISIDHMVREAVSIALNRRYAEFERAIHVEIRNAVRREIERMEWEGREIAEMARWNREMATYRPGSDITRPETPPDTRDINGFNLDRHIMERERLSRIAMVRFPLSVTDTGMDSTDAMRQMAHVMGVSQDILNPKVPNPKTPEKIDKIEPPKPVDGNTIQDTLEI
jgi:hypothetical protein